MTFSRPTFFICSLVICALGGAAWLYGQTRMTMAAPIPVAQATQVPALIKLSAAPTTPPTLRKTPRQQNPGALPVHPKPAAPDALAFAWQAWQAGQLSLAEQYYRQRLADAPRCREAMLGMAAIAARRGHYPEVTEWYQRLLILNPRDQLARNGLLATTPGALKPDQHLENTDTPTALLAQHHVQNEYWASASARYRQAAAENPESPDLQYNLAVVLDHLGETRAARLHYRQALTLAQLQLAHFAPAAVAERLAEIGNAP